MHIFLNIDNGMRFILTPRPHSNLPWKVSPIVQGMVKLTGSSILEGACLKLLGCTLELVIQ